MCIQKGHEDTISLTKACVDNSSASSNLDFNCKSLDYLGQIIILPQMSSLCISERLKIWFFFLYFSIIFIYFVNLFYTKVYTTSCAFDNVPINVRHFVHKYNNHEHHLLLHKTELHCIGFPLNYVRFQDGSEH